MAADDLTWGDLRPGDIVRDSADVMYVAVTIERFRRELAHASGPLGERYAYLLAPQVRVTFLGLDTGNIVAVTDYVNKELPWPIEGAKR